MSILEMFLALPDGSKKEYQETLDGFTKYVVALDIKIANRHGRNKKETERIVKTAYDNYRRRTEPVVSSVKEPLFMPWEDGTKEEVINCFENPHELGSLLEQIENKK